MKYLWTTLQVSNMDQSLDFYQNIIGLTCNERHPAGPGMELAFLGEGETKIELIFRGERSKEEHHGISMGFQVDSLEDTIKRLKGYGMAHIGEIMEPNPRVRFFFVKDPDGYPVQFVEIR